jgi:hypothetical protein
VTEIVIGGDRENVAEGTYPATLTKLVTKQSPKFGGDFRVWTFQLADGSEVEGTSSMYTNPKSKPGRWMAALLGRRLVEGETVTLIGRPCLVSVIVDGDYPKVDAVLPPMAGTVPLADGRPLPMTDGSRGVQMYDGMGDDPPVLTELP